jgi:uncharacterized protein (TIGR03437 family)
MNRTRSLLCLSAAVILSGASLAAQTTGGVVTITTSVPGMRFSVDGTNYRTSAGFTWSAGSMHTLSIPPGDDIIVNPGVKTTFTGWANAAGTFSNGGQTVVITADGKAANYIAQYSKQYQVSLQFQDGRGTSGSGAPVCGQPGVPIDSLSGVVSLDGTCYWGDYSYWTAPGVIKLQAQANSGYVFAGWSFNNAKSGSYITTFDVEAPLQIQVRFTRAARVQFMTDPAGLKVMLDYQTVPTPTALPCPDGQSLPAATGGSKPLCYGEFDLLPGSSHVISAPSPQKVNASQYWVFSSWATGGGQNTTFVAPLVGAETKLTAKFVPGATASLVTVPNGLKLVVDGRDNWPSLNFIWGVGIKHTISAPSQQTDAKGRKYVFGSWSNGASQTQDVAVASDGLRLIATYQRLNRAVVQSNVPGLKVMVDGKPCVMPCMVDRPTGSTAIVSPSRSIAVSDVTRYDFTGWPGGGYGDTTITFDRDYQVLQANYVTMNRLMTASDPAGAVDIVTQPGSGDGYYQSNAQLVVTAKPHPGFKFVRWDGDLSGTYSTGYLDMGAPRTVRVILNKVPYIAPAGVRNAAGETPVTGVAAGSLISIFGENLAEKYEAGTSSPLAQTLGDLVVQVEDKLLGLVYVSPQQINALLPVDFWEGEHKLVIKRNGVADVTGQFTVVRNAPGLFSTTVDTKVYAAALHEDGTSITVSSPARRGERVTLLGTGFGPYDKHPVEGFALPATPQITLVDNAEIAAGDLRLPTVWSGAAPGFVGVAASRFRIADELPSGAPEIRLIVNGTPSNAVLLPVE